ncbi:hypothetical protein CHS0354_035145 [Potamilus streckersoni]|uniref:Fibronectin type-III domain-containing protein n=1 Tax=Potamilus streckersoni TaxID=2493646 RepID=A0AAE0W0L1_9BIVA|nr:hypothetical protein CHS0354_035145 [Potamilus streckersoni]
MKRSLDSFYIPVSEVPTNVSISNVTSRSFTISWDKPRNAFGELIGYILIISSAEDKVCVVEEFINCSTGCKSAFPNQTVISPACKEKTKYQNVDKTELLSRRNFTASLNPDTEYTVSVAAVNQGGKGHTEDIKKNTWEEGRILI